MYLSKHKKSGDTFTIFDTMESLSPSGFDYERKDSTQRRLYDIINILEGLGWAKRDPKQKKTYTWLGDDDFIDGLKKSRGKPSEMHNYRPIQPIDGYTKIDQSLPTLTKNFIGLLFCSHELEIDLDTVALTLLPSDDKKCQTKLRRFYDIANVLDGLNLIEKAGKKKCYRWTYERESLLSLKKAVDDSLNLGGKSESSENGENAHIQGENCGDEKAKCQNSKILQPKHGINTSTPKHLKQGDSCPDSGIAVTPKETNIHSAYSDSTPVRPRKNPDGQNKNPDVRSKMDILLQVSADLLSTPRKTHEFDPTGNRTTESYCFLNDSKQTVEFTTPPPKISPKMHKLIQTSPWLLDELINARIREREKQNQENTATPESGKNSDKMENVRRNLKLDFN